MTILTQHSAAFLVLVCIAVAGCDSQNDPSIESRSLAAAQDPGAVRTPAENDSAGSATHELEDDQTSSEQAPVVEDKNPPPASNETTNNEVQEITFEDLNLRLQADVAFRPWMLTEAVQELDGRTVRLSGYMLPDGQLKGIKEFVLLRNTECKFGPGGQADHLVMIKLQDGLTTSYTEKVVQVDGMLKINPFQGPDGNTWSIYDLLGNRVVHRRR